MLLGGDESLGNDRDGWAPVVPASLFTGVSPEDLKRISAAARPKRFARGAILYLERDMVKQVLLLNSGSVKFAQLGSKGLEVILRLGAPGDVFDVVSLFTTGKHATAAEAIRSCETLVWDAEVFKALVEGQPVLYKNIIRLIGGHLLELEERFRELATERVAPRVARQLIRLQEQAGSLLKAEKEIGLSHERLAQMTGTTLFTVNRLLSTWEEHGLVNSGSESVIITDVRALRKVIEEH